MRSRVNFLFVVDVSGSMYGQKIASVNAALAECLSELTEISFVENADIRVSVATFAEKLQIECLNKSPEAVGSLELKVEPHADGFYQFTSFACLYDGIRRMFETNAVSDGEQGRRTFIVLFSDARPVDEKEYSSAYQAAQQQPCFKNAARYVAYVEEKTDKYNKNTVQFVDFKAERIVHVSKIPGEMSLLQMTFFSGLSHQSENEKYDRIFT